MLSVRRVLVPITVAALALFAAGCGVEAGDQGRSATTTEAPSSAPDDLTPQQQQARDSMVETYRSLGLDQKQAECLADGMMGYVGEGGSPTSAPDMMDIINECDISVSDLSGLGQDPGGNGSIEDTVRKTLETSFENQGLTKKQASCVADAFIEEFGTDSSAMDDFGKIRPLLEGCDVDPADFGN